MGIIAYLLLFVIVGVLVWLLIKFVPMPDEFKHWLPFIALGLMLLLLVTIVFGIGPGHDVAIPRLR